MFKRVPRRQLLAWAPTRVVAAAEEERAECWTTRMRLIRCILMSVRLVCVTPCLLGLVVALGCGRIGFDSHDSEGTVDGGGSDGSTTADAREDSPVGPLAFLSSSWLPAGGLLGADAHCVEDASAAGIPRTFRAVLATSTLNATTRVSSFPSAAWLQRDGASAAFYDEKATALTVFGTLTQQADGSLSQSNQVWVGATSPTTLGSETCVEWVNLTESAWVIPRPFDGYWFADAASVSCGTARPLFCLETPE